MLHSFRGIAPQPAPDVWAAESAQIIGDVSIESGASIWYGAVLRGDQGHIHIGKRTNIQDNCVLHSSVTVGDGVTVGHGAILHGCTVEDGALIGMGAIIMDGCVIGSGSLVAAGALVTKSKQIPPHSLVMGAPAKVVRELTDEEIEMNANSAAEYLEEAAGSLPLLKA